MSKAELIFEYDSVRDGARNLNSSPLDITRGVRGNEFDYELASFFEDEGVNSGFEMTFNSDTSSNYRNYRMTGDGSSATAAVGDTSGDISLAAHAYTYPSLCIAKITGDSSEERVIDYLTTISASASDTRIRKSSSYWKDTLNEITSIQLTKSASVTSNCHILLYRVPKAANQGNWEKVDELTWSSETAEKSFTGLDGNRDKKYKVVWSGDQNFNIEINNDGTTSYQRQYLRNNGGSIQAQNTNSPAIQAQADNCEILINAETGSKRLCVVSGSSYINVVEQSERSVWYSNTVTNITTLDCTPTASATGTATLYRMKGNGETDGSLPWELIEEVDVSGDFSGGHTFSNLTGNSEKLYRVEFLGSGGYLQMQLQFNADTGTNYTYQNLVGSSGSVSASTNTLGYTPFCESRVSEMTRADMIIYPKSGSQRASLLEYDWDESKIFKNANWWSNTVNEITSIKINASASSTLTGKLKLWRLK